MSSDTITPESVVKMYQALDVTLPGKVAVKVHSGEAGNQNFFRPEFWKPMIDLVRGTVAETNTTQKHKKLMFTHGWSQCFDVDILDAEGPDLRIEIPDVIAIKENFVGKNIRNYDSMLVLAH